MAQLPRVQNFLGCIELYIGAIVIGLFELLQGFRSFFYEGGIAQRYSSGTVALILGIILLIGVWKKNRTLLQIFVWVAIIYAVYNLIIAVLSFVTGKWLGYVIFNIIAAVLNAYFSIVVNSYLLGLEESFIPGNV